MADWDDDDLDWDDDHRTSSGGSKTVWIVLGIAGGGMLLVLTCAGLLVFTAMNRVKEAGRQLTFDELIAQSTAVEMPPAEVESAEEKHQAVTAAFNADDVGVDDATIAAIQKLFDDLIENSQNSDTAAILDAFDIDRFLLRSKKTGEIQSMTLLEEGELRQLLEQSTQNLANLQRHVLIHVDSIRARREFVVYAYMWDGGNVGREMRWWVIRNRDSWHFFDWEFLDFGIAESKTEAICYAHRHNPAIGEFINATRDVDSAWTSHENGDLAAARKALRRAEGRNVFPQLANDIHLRVAYAWTSIGRPREVVAAAKRIDAPDEVPGACFVQAISASRRLQHEQTIEWADKYIERVGGGPSLLSLRSNALTALKRESEAIPDLLRWLRYEPENIEAQSQLAKALPDDRKQELKEHFAKLEDPVTSAEQLAQRLSYSNPELLPVMIDFVAEREKDSATVDYLKGRAAERNADNSAAAEHYQKAISKEQDNEKRSQYMYQYLDVMAVDEKFLEAYETAHDKADAFKYLLEGYDDEPLVTDNEVKRQLIAAHRKHEPNDPWIRYHTAVILTEEKKYDEAEQEFAAAMAAAKDEDVASSMKYTRISSLIQAGRGLEAYEKIGRDEETFRLVASQLRYSNRTDVLEALVQRHRRAHADDSQLDLYAGIVALQREDYRTADRLLGRGYRAAAANNEHYIYREPWIEVRFKMGRPLTAYGDIKPDEDTFASLARRLSNDEEWDDLQTLINLHRLQHRDDAAIRTWELDMYWKRKDYGAVVQMLTPWEERVVDAGIFPWQTSELADKLLRSYLRLGQFDKAIEFAADLYLDDGQPNRLIIAHAAAGNRDQVARYMKIADGISDGRSGSSAYADEDVGSTLRSAEYLPLRKQHPASLPYRYHRTQIVLLLSQPRAMEAVSMKAQLAEALGDEVTVEKLPPGTPPQTESWLVQIGADRFVVTTGDGHYMADDVYARQRLQKATLIDSIDKHLAWMTVTAFANSWRDDSQIIPTCRLAMALHQEDWLAAFFQFNNQMTDDFEKLRMLLENRPTLRELREIGESTYLYRDDGSDDGNDADDRSMRRRLKEFVDQFESKKAEDEFAVQVNLNAGLARESHWIQVTGIQPTTYAGWQFIGEFATDSILYPEMQAGEPVVISSYEITNWRLTRDGKQTLGRKPE